MSRDLFPLPLENTYATELPGLFAPATGDKAPDPQFVYTSESLARELGFDASCMNSLAPFFTGGQAPEGAAPATIAMAYAGHQFGGYSPRLGDGRALLLGEIVDANGSRRDLHLKGSGRTPYSRGGDGKAALGPVLREVLLGEAMHALGIPTTRALAALTTGEAVYRDREVPGAVLVRVAKSHLRVGTFEYARDRGDGTMQNLADYAIARHFPHLEAGPDRYLQLLRAVIEGQASLLARWMNVGFVHGVMNTDNMTISGETIDYGPCAFVDTYHSSSVFSSIDRNGRYAYGNQPPIAQWNLSRFAETLLPLLPGETTEAKVAAATAELEAFGRTYRAHWLSGMRAKLGWEDDGSDGTSDDALATALLEILERNEVDFTRFFRALPGGLAQVKFLFLDESEIGAWLTKWEARCNATRAAGVSDGEASAAREAHMNRVNPVYIPRNHLVEEALAAAVDEGNFGPFQTLLTLVSTPFVEREGTEANPHAFARYALGAPKSFYPYQTFCGT